MKARIIDALCNAKEAEAELAGMIHAANNRFAEDGYCESAVDEALDLCEQVHAQLLIIHQFYRSADEWEGERWR